ncbi:MAG: hypothetical protein EOP09_19410 [Proteobacteria bacterium]|nr:MAG: hypothetical protein EOP09_19410 [Pseudomonadota bacterium]
MRDRHHAGPFPARPRLQGFVFSAAQIYQLRVYLDQYVRSTRSPLPEATPFGFFWNLMGTSTP